VRSYSPQFIFTTALPPVVAAGACAAVRHLKSSNEERGRHQYMAAVTKHALRAAGLPILENPPHIVPVMIGDADRCKAASGTASIFTNQLSDSPDREGASAHHPTPRHNETHVSALVEAFVNVWKTLDLPFLPARILTLRERRPNPECVYPTMRKAAE
jgi:5-aminolevulinate synthase